jgi:hypothetical protein
VKLRDFGTDVGRSEDDHDFDIDRGGTAGSWRKTKAGLILILICTIIALVIWGLVGLLTLDETPRHDNWFPWDVQATLLIAFTHPVLVLATFIGVFLCCTAPHPPVHKRAEILAFLLATAPVVIILMIMGGIRIPLQDPFFSALAFGFAIGVMVFWYLFHSAVAGFFQNASLRKFSILAMILALAILSLFALFVVVGSPPFQQAERLYFRLAWITTTIILGMNLVLCIKTIRAINRGTVAPS